MTGQRSISTKSSLTKSTGISSSKSLYQNFSAFFSSTSPTDFSFPARYSVEFSKPSKQKPIPEGTVKVLFDIIQMDGDEYEVEFNFENESLKHKLDNTMRTNMFQVSQIQPLLITLLYFLVVDR